MNKKSGTHSRNIFANPSSFTERAGVPDILLLCIVLCAAVLGLTVRVGRLFGRKAALHVRLEEVWVYSLLGLGFRVWISKPPQGREEPKFNFLNFEASLQENQPISFTSDHFFFAFPASKTINAGLFAAWAQSKWDTLSRHMIRQQPVRVKSNREGTGCQDPRGLMMRQHGLGALRFRFSIFEGRQVARGITEVTALGKLRCMIAWRTSNFEDTQLTGNC